MSDLRRNGCWGRNRVLRLRAWPDRGPISPPCGRKGNGAGHGSGGDGAPDGWQAFYQVLSQRENRYLARQMCWVFTVQGLETYLLHPHDPADLDLLVGAIEPSDSAGISAVIGVRGPVAPPAYCNGLMVPIVAFDQIYTFSRDALIEAILRPDQIAAEQFGAASRELFDRIMQMTDNAGATDEHRALNYLAMRYPAIYARAGPGLRGERFAERGRRAPVAAQRNAKDRGSDLLPHQPQH